MSHFSSVEADFLRRLAVERPPDARSKVAKDFARTHHMGRVDGSRVVYQQRDYEAAANALTSRGYSLAARQSGLTRSEASPGGSEKAGARNVTADLLLAVPLHSDVRVPRWAPCLTLDPNLLEPDEFEVVLVCENFETLRQIGTFAWLSKFTRERRTLAIFRGMPGAFGTSAAAQLLGRDNKPVLAFLDFDPQGLAMAAALPRLEAVCLPDPEALAEATRRFHRTHLFLDQVVGCKARLDALPPEHPVRSAWDLMKSLQSGLNQENFPR